MKKRVSYKLQKGSSSNSSSNIAIAQHNASIPICDSRDLHAASTIAPSSVFYPIFSSASHSYKLSFSLWGKAIFIFSILILFATGLWSSTSDVFSIPHEVTLAYTTYTEAKRKYYQNPVYWDSKREHFQRALEHDFSTQNGENIALLLETMTPEMMISLLVETLKFPKERMEAVSIMMKEVPFHSTVIISKFDQAIWPLKIIVSLEAEISLTAQGIHLFFTRLRRGSEDLATGLAWAYFGSDLEILKPISMVSMRTTQPIVATMNPHQNRRNTIDR